MRWTKLAGAVETGGRAIWDGRSSWGRGGYGRLETRLAAVSRQKRLEWRQWPPHTLKPCRHSPLSQRCVYHKTRMKAVRPLSRGPGLVAGHAGACTNFSEAAAPLSLW